MSKKAELCPIFYLSCLNVNLCAIFSTLNWLCFSFLFQICGFILAIVFFILCFIYYRRVRKIRLTEVAWEGDKTRTWRLHVLDTCKGDGNWPKALVGRAFFETHVDSMLYINAYFVKKDMFVYLVVFMQYCLVTVNWGHNFCESVVFTL